MHRKTLLILGALSTLALFACVTINVYFPEAAVKDLSEQIEEAIAKEAAKAPDSGTAPATEPEEAPVAPPASSFNVSALLGSALALLGPTPVYADEDVAAPAVSNPAIRKLIESRAQRVKDINRYKSAGVLGENREALLEIRQLDSLPLAERAAVQKLVKQENADREQMFKEIAAATGADLSTLPQIRETYAQTLREKAQPGDWIQQPDGTWKQK